MGERKGECKLCRI